MSYSVGSTTGANGTQETYTGTQDAAGKATGDLSTQFISLLVAELRNQNPLEPMAEKDMMNQITQMNSLQELQKLRAGVEEMASASNFAYGSSLIGKMVTATDDRGKEMQGIVTSVDTSSESVYLTINNQRVALSNVIEIKAEEEETSGTSTSSTAEPA